VEPGEPAAEFGGRVGPQRNDPLFAALAVEVHGGLAVDEDVADFEGGQL
jgi:hypothetical protein